MLEPEAVKKYYDRFGARQDGQAFYEDAALDGLMAHADFAAAGTVAELGCGTGRFAARILGAAPAASYVGYDVSTTMLDLARRRLAPFGVRARVEPLAPGAVALPLPSGSVDRLVSTYVLDLLGDRQIAGFLAEAGRVLRPDGRLCLVSLTAGDRVLPAVVSGLWSLVYRLSPALVGGCRPIRLAPLCAAQPWRPLHHATVIRWGITSEVLVVARAAPASV